MTITVRHETGNPEGIAKTIGALIEREWTTSLVPDDLDPAFYYDDQITENWPVKGSKFGIYFNYIETQKIATRSSSGKETTGYMDLISIDGFAPNTLIAQRCIQNITSIIQDKYANSGNRILKSDNSSISRITTFEHEPNFRIIPKNASGQPNSIQFTSILGCMWNTIKS